MHEHKTYGINWRNPARNYTHEAIKNYEFCPECDRLIYRPQIIRAVDL